MSYCEFKKISKYRRLISDPTLSALQCFEDFVEEVGDILFCEASCGGPVHKICIAQWLATKPDPTCIYCRAPWPKAGGAGGAGGAAAGRDGQYVNLANAVGISPARDTSSYYHG
jgi:hypothetical protein